MPAYVSDELRARVATADHQRCAYCLIAQAFTGLPLTVDHIHPTSLGGESTFRNLCLACRSCNEHKGSRVKGIDPLTGDEAALYHPRRDRWADHFAWNIDASRIVGLTPVGRATIVSLRMNHAEVMAARLRWAQAGWHPPTD